ncbi:MAG: purine-binding chemotaxis protein CheW [Acidobacteriota bacterium]|jgi:chemotaxis signal transduction protein|nr:purine-binding chemotaxis protein CheW [Acidobacteriota bacterium]
MSEPENARSRQEGTHLLVRAGEYACALPLSSVRRVVRALTVHPLPGAAGELDGLAEFGGEPLPVLNLARLVNAPAGPNPTYPVTVVVWVGPVEAREMLGLAADSALEVVHVQAGSVVAGDGGFLLGEAPVGGEVVRVLNLEALGRAH